MHQPVQAIPVLPERGKQAVDLGVVLDVEREHERAAEVRGHLRHALLETFVLVRECEFRALTVHRLRDTVGDRAVAQQAGDEDAFAGKKTHGR